MVSDCVIIECVINALRTRRCAFTYNYHNRVSIGECGLYSFWCRSRCLYVGMSTNLHQRMLSHRLREHNAMLAKYFRAFPQNIEVSYVALGDKSGIELRCLERKAIRFLRPATNINHNP